MPPDSDNQPPSLIWLQWYGDGDPELEVGFVSEDDVTWCRDHIFEHDIPYVPRTEVDAVWEKCWLLLHETRMSKHSSARDKIVIQDDRKNLIAALEAARDESEKQG